MKWITRLISHMLKQVTIHLSASIAPPTSYISKTVSNFIQHDGKSVAPPGFRERVASGLVPAKPLDGRGFSVWSVLVGFGFSPPALHHFLEMCRVLEVTEEKPGLFGFCASICNTDGNGMGGDLIVPGPHGSDGPPKVSLGDIKANPHPLASLMDPNSSQRDSCPHFSKSSLCLSPKTISHTPPGSSELPLGWHHVHLHGLHTYSTS